MFVSLTTHQQCDTMQVEHRLAPTLFTLVAAVILLVVSGLMPPDFLQTMRPIPGQRLGLSNGTTVFIRDPQHDHKYTTSVPDSMLIGLLACCYVIMLSLPPLFTLAWGSCSAHVCSKGLVAEALASGNAWLCATALNAFFTDILKRYVGRLRPNFYSLCGWSDALMRCTIDSKSSRRSFPSGHSSSAVASCLVLSLALRLHLDSAQSVVPRKSVLYHVLAIAAASPVAVALWVCSSRVYDNWHFPSDVVGGAMLGAACAWFCFGLYAQQPPATGDGAASRATVFPATGASGPLSSQDAETGRPCDTSTMAFDFPTQDAYRVNTNHSDASGDAGVPGCATALSAELV